ncbi:MAG: double-strand break repair protein AddB [Synechococcus sp. SB0666_bin_14]|nr:double-strand break repair protein AddB [Synechococcus sp. SB0666_bin_14]MYG47681.1 double-strand break repair protein AddB [Synechococcus sp. SB0675_bin_6]MYJ59809.1 double-strand break repair protein AddB [Synechococcus sp. SB0672_bin_6]MYK91427.1 double-strand break repair protein AddB [Synechococcus sp. SB0669_bin_8]
MATLFGPTTSPRVYGVPPGVDFPKALLTGLRERLHGQPPEALARIHLVVNSRRMKRRLVQLLHSATPCLLPAIDLVATYHGNAPQALMLPPAIPSLRRQLQLGRLIGKLLEQQPDLAPRACRYPLAKSLARLMDELQDEGVDPQVVQELDVGELSGHWQRSRTFLGLVQEYLQTIGGLDARARQRRVIEGLVSHWRSHPPGHPVIVAGSTGSRSSTRLLMEAVARLSQGALVLPGFDFDLPAAVWSRLKESPSSPTPPLEDHPQQRFCQLLQALRMAPQAVQPWTEIHPVAPARNRLVSLALRPAPVTDAWLEEGPSLGHLGAATEGLTLLEAPGLRQEALTIALRLRQALEDGHKAALMTPDRRLARHVSAALDCWGVVADDSAGLPLQLSPPGRFLRQVAQLMTQPLTTSALLSLLQHPLCHAGSARTVHLRYSRALELWLRKTNHSFPTATVLRAFSQRQQHQAPAAAPTGAPTETAWLHWLNACLSEPPQGEQPLEDWVQRLQEVALLLVAGCEAHGASEAHGPDQAGSPLWMQEDGRMAQKVVAALAREAPEGGAMDALAFWELLRSLLSAEAVRNPEPETGKVVIWSPWEARSHDAHLLILGGLNEGCWPEALAPDLWLNRSMRRQAGLPLPEYRLGLAAHDLQQVVAAPQVWLSRSTRSNDGETVPCRWLNRLTNLLHGLPEQGGRQCLEVMTQRGQQWLDWAQELETPTPGLVAAARPCPVPPVAARPHRLSVTEIRTLVKDPYSVYAKRVLRLAPLNPLEQAPDALLRGVAIHRVMENVLRAIQGDPTALDPQRRPQTRRQFLQIAEDTLKTAVPWPAVQRLWLARLDRLADWFLNTEVERQRQGRPFAFEVKGEAPLDLHLDDGQSFRFVLSATADRIDQTSDGWLVYDYKTGAIPSAKEQEKGDKQLLLEMAMVEKGAFEGISPGPAQGGVFIGVGSNPDQKTVIQESREQTMEALHTLLCAYMNPTTGYQSRRLLPMEAPGPYDHLARFGEWDSATKAHPQPMT